MNSKLRSYLPDFAFLFGVSGLSILIDQLTKWLVRTSLQFTETWVPWDWLAPYARIVHWKNTGAAFGIFQNGNGIITVLAIIVSLAIINYFPLLPRNQVLFRFALALQMGGAVGNLLDRLARGYVTDFLSVGSLPVFNVADASISIGVVLVLVPYLPEMWREFTESRLLRAANQLNKPGRKMNLDRKAIDEPISLGLIELLFENNDSVRKFVSDQKIRTLRKRVLERPAGSSR